MPKKEWDCLRIIELEKEINRNFNSRKPINYQLITEYNTIIYDLNLNKNKD